MNMEKEEKHLNEDDKHSLNETEKMVTQFT
jgi:hypothetical protein